MESDLFFPIAIRRDKKFKLMLTNQNLLHRDLRERQVFSGF